MSTRPIRKLALYAAGLVAVAGVSVAAGVTVDQTGLANAKAPEAHQSAMPEGMVPGLGAADGSYRLHPLADTLPANTPATYEFRIDGQDGPVTEFEIEHTKPMHVIVVRRDFAGFQHLHPAMAPDGTWSTPLAVAEPGAYRVFADFVVDGVKQTLGTDLFVAGDFQPRPLAPPSTVAVTTDGYTVELSGELVAGDESTLTFAISHDGQILTDVPMYLGARGHLVALRDGDLAYLHVHADEDELSFDAEFPTPGSYRLFLQFSHNNDVHTAAFTVVVPEETR
jgi:hypothetical protein